MKKTLLLISLLTIGTAGVIDTTNMNEALRMVEASRRIRVPKETLPSGAENNKTPLVVKAPLCKVSLA